MNVKVYSLKIINKMPLFNNLIDVGVTDPTILKILNLLVIVHLIAFVIMIIIVVRNMFKSEQ